MDTVSSSNLSGSEPSGIDFGGLQTLSHIYAEQLKQTEFTNEEILELCCYFAMNGEDHEYGEHFQILRDKYDTRLSPIPFELQFLLLPDRIDEGGLRRLYSGLADVGYDPTITHIIDVFQNDPSAGIYIARVCNVFHRQLTLNQIDHYIHYIEDSGNSERYEADETACAKVLGTDDPQACEELKEDIDRTTEPMSGPGINAVLRYLYEKADQLSAYVPRPDWVRDLDIDVDTLRSLKPKDPEEDDRRIAEYVLSHQEVYDYQLDLDSLGEEDPVGELAERIKGLSFIVKEDLARIVNVDIQEIEEIRNDRALTQVFGPVNPFADDDFSGLTLPDGDLDPNKIYGGPRMFLYIGNEYDYENDLPVEDWFTGVCQWNSRKIQKRHYAVRRPYLVGGWYGCFCSWNCVRAFVYSDYVGRNKIITEDIEGRTQPDSENALNEQGTEERLLYQTEMQLIDSFEDLLNTVWIAERDDTPDVIIEPFSVLPSEEIPNTVTWDETYLSS